MRKMATRFAVLIALGALLLSGCDFMRSLAGRPTSGDLARKRDSLEAVALRQAEEAARQQALAQHRADSLAARERYVRDSTAAMEGIQRDRVMMLAPAKLKGLYRTTLDKKFYVVVGSFREKPNALKKQSSLSSAGYESEIISFGNGYHAIGAGATDHVADAYALLQELQQKKLCPGDAWILVNE